MPHQIARLLNCFQLRKSSPLPASIGSSLFRFAIEQMTWDLQNQRVNPLSLYLLLLCNNIYACNLPFLLSSISLISCLFILVTASLWMTILKLFDFQWKRKLFNFLFY